MQEDNSEMKNRYFERKNNDIELMLFYQDDVQMSIT